MLCVSRIISLSAVLALFTDPTIGHPGSQIVHHGKFNTHINTFKYQLSLYDGDVFICGAAIISSQWAITTAHCTQVKNKRILNLRRGISIGEGEVFPVVNIVTHPNFDDHILDFDYALLKAEKPFGDPKTIKSYQVSLPKTHRLGLHNMRANVSGWGTTKDGDERPTKHLKFATVTILPHEFCRTHHVGMRKRMLCASHKENPWRSCQGDTGGPLVHKNTLVGMVSWGQHCQTLNDTVVYAAIAPIQKWIRKHLGM